LTILLTVLVLCLLVVVPAASAKKGGTDRPIKADLSGTLTFEFDWEDPYCPVTTITETFGTMSHLGTVEAIWEHCPPVYPDHEGYRNGHVVFTAANGDQLEGAYENVDDLPWPIEITGGTGRFDDASGTIYLADFDAIGEWDETTGLPIQPWDWWGILEGSISY
jgi:hypothetical protein